MQDHRVRVTLQQRPPGGDLRRPAPEASLAHTPGTTAGPHRRNRSKSFPGSHSDPLEFHLAYADQVKTRRMPIARHRRMPVDEHRAAGECNSLPGRRRTRSRTTTGPPRRTSAQSHPGPYSYPLEFHLAYADQVKTRRMPIARHRRMPVDKHHAAGECNSYRDADARNRGRPQVPRPANVGSNVTPGPYSYPLDLHLAYADQVKTRRMRDRPAPADAGRRAPRLANATRPGTQTHAIEDDHRSPAANVG